VRIALVYDCMDPPSVGGAERWLRLVAEDLKADHEVTYITRRQWRGEGPIVGVRCVAVAPGGPLTTADGRRRLLPPLVFGAGVFVHLLRHRRAYDVVHCLSYPYVPVLSARLALAGRGGGQLLVEWLECLTPGYWRDYAGWFAGALGRVVQWLCIRATPTAICFSRHTAERLRASGLRGPIHRLGGLWEPRPGQEATGVAPQPAGDPPFVLFAARHVPDKLVTSIPGAVAFARRYVPELRAVIAGDGPLRETVEGEVRRLSLEDVVELPGFVSSARLGELMRSAACVVVPSRRDGHGMVAAEAAAASAPVVVVRAPDSALSELIEEGVNGAVAETAEPDDLAAAITRVIEGGSALRTETAQWWQANRTNLSAAASIERLREIYAGLSAEV
jgi:glycosyltransferase involved in cell wall biosynthesis